MKLIVNEVAPKVKAPEYPYFARGKITNRNTLVLSPTTYIYLTPGKSYQTLPGQVITDCESEVARLNTRIIGTIQVEQE